MKYRSLIYRGYDLQEQPANWWRVSLKGVEQTRVVGEDNAMQWVDREKRRIAQGGIPGVSPQPNTGKE